MTRNKHPLPHKRPNSKKKVSKSSRTVPSKESEQNAVESSKEPEQSVVESPTEWESVWNTHMKIYQSEVLAKYDRNNFNNNLLHYWYAGWTNYIRYGADLGLSPLEKRGYSKIGNISLQDLPSLVFESTCHPQVFITKDVVPIELARDCRKFLSSSWVKHTEDTVMLRTISDELELNRTHMLSNLYDSVLIHLRSNNNLESYDYGMWKWEKYNPGFYRATPSNYFAFIMSPIFKLIQCLIARWEHTTRFSDYKMHELHLDTFVIQKITQGNGIRPHNDAHDKRRIAFTYYLTDDDQSENDGGEFCVMSESETYDSFVPEFNSMILMTMKDNKSPLHKVDTVKSTKDRYSLVGFLSDN